MLENVQFTAILFEGMEELSIFKIIFKSSHPYHLAKLHFILGTSKPCQNLQKIKSKVNLFGAEKIFYSWTTQGRCVSDITQIIY